MNGTTIIETLLPAPLQDKAKAIIGGTGIVLTVVSGTLQDVPIWITIVLGVLTAGGVYGTPAPGYTAPTDRGDGYVPKHAAPDDAP